jgi:SPP1 gp7 family putative phage head morphogenesis protein
MGKPKRTALKGEPLNPNIGVEKDYFEDLENLILIMTEEAEDRLDHFFKTPHAENYFTAQDISVSSQARILLAALLRNFERLFGERAKPMAERMTRRADKNSAQQLKKSLKKLAEGVTLSTNFMNGPIADVYKASIEENVSLIKSIAAQYHKAISGAVYRSITTGQGLKELVPFLQKYKGVTLRRARFIAEDQTRKAFNTLNKARMQELGVDQYEWLHTGGSQHPRPLHVRMSGNIYKFSKPPIIDEKTKERGIPGQLVNCRCRMIPVIKFKEN